MIHPHADSHATAARILWHGAGCPAAPDEVTRNGPCWWCGLDCAGRARPLSCLASTFPDDHLAAAPESRFLCAACGWTLNDRVSLPAEQGQSRIRMKAEAGRRAKVSLRGAEPDRYLLLELADGRVGLWSCGPNARAEKPWEAARDALREAPADVGPCRFLEAVSYDDLDPGPVEKFRCFHHLGTARRWRPCTDTHRMEIREWLLSPPAEPWVGIIGDGKKHAAIYAEFSPGRVRIHSRPRADADGQVGLFSQPPGDVDAEQRVYFRGQMIDYLPAELARQIAAVEALVVAGARDEEIASGDYAPRAELVIPLATHEPTIAPLRGSPTVDLLLYLRRNAKELRP